MATPAPAGFIVKPVRNRTVGGLRGTDTIGMVLHVQAGNGALSEWFDNPAARASSTWWAGKAGGRQQYGNPDTDKFWAQAAGNPLYHSIETEGYPSEPLTPEQIETCAVAYAFGHVRYGWPFRLAEKPGQPGLGWHGMGGAAWGGHTGCPGDKRKAQRTQILARAKQIVGGHPNEEDDMQLTDKITVTKADGSGTEVIPLSTLLNRMQWVYAETIRQRATEAAQTAAIQALAQEKGADAAAITKAVVDKIAALQITLTPKEN